MIALLLAALMAVQGAGKLQPGTGIVTGTLKTTDGKPAVGVRVGVVDVDDPSASSLLSVAETDSAGRYRLINVPIGSYYIVAGRLSDLRYFPSGADRSTATQVQVEAARTRADVNFTVPGGSQRPVTPQAAASRQAAESNLHQQVTAENNLARKLQLLGQFEKSFPKSERLSALYLSVMTAYIGRNHAPLVLEYAEKAVKANPANIATLIQVSRAYAGPPLQMTDKALAYAERAATLAAGLKNEAPQTRVTQAWQDWATSMNKSAQENLAWVRQVDAWQRKALSSLVAPTRSR
jgi:5-hydroxyisourate hydrolase-like protein (transthyretin family)